MPSDLRTRAIVLRRTNYGESDRILNLLTPEGKVSVLARGVRKEKSRLAGGIEPFSVTDVVIHQGRASLGTLTSAKMLKFYNNLLTDLTRLELASTFLKRIDRAAEQVTTPEHFSLLEQSLAGLNQMMNLSVVATWFALNMHRVSGEELNLICDTAGENLSPDLKYFWDSSENALRPHSSGKIGAQQIKLARFLLSNKLVMAKRIEQINDVIVPVYELSKMLG